MSIALFGISSIYNGIQKFMNASANLHQISAQAANNAQFSSATQQRALRVVRIAEQGDAAHSAGRMVISGRMADVCAELDRLVALEAKNKGALPH
jgi:hypothetical protein